MMMSTRKSITCLLMAMAIAGCHAPYVEEPYDASQPLDLVDVDRDGVVNARDACAESLRDGEIDIVGCAKWTPEPVTEDFFFAFDFDSSRLRPEHTAQLDRVAALIESSPGAKVFLVGDTSSEGTDRYNHALGIRRADVIVAELVHRGVNRGAVQEYVFDQPSMKGVLKKRERRTIVRVQHQSESPVKRWTIYTNAPEGYADAPTGYSNPAGRSVQ